LSWIQTGISGENMIKPLIKELENLLISLTGKLINSKEVMQMQKIKQTRDQFTKIKQNIKQ